MAQTVLQGIDPADPQLGNVFKDIEKVLKDVVKLVPLINDGFGKLGHSVDNVPESVLGEFRKAETDLSGFEPASVKAVLAALKAFENVTVEIGGDAAHSLESFTSIRAEAVGADPIAQTRTDLVEAIADLAALPKLVKSIDLQKLTNSPSSVENPFALIPAFPFTPEEANGFIRAMSDLHVIPVYVVTLGHDGWHQLPKTAIGKVRSIIENQELPAADGTVGDVGNARTSATALLSTAFVTQTITNLLQQVIDAIPNYTGGLALLGEGGAGTFPKIAWAGVIYPIIVVTQFITDALNLAAEIVLIHESGDDAMEGAALAATAARLSNRGRRR